MKRNIHSFAATHLTLTPDVEIAIVHLDTFQIADLCHLRLPRIHAFEITQGYKILDGLVRHLPIILTSRTWLYESSLLLPIRIFSYKIICHI